MRIAVALSGGVDSAVAALLLAKQGYDVVGVAFKTDYTISCRHVADHLGIEFVELDFSAHFRNKVFSYFVEEYLRGRTPNPCIVCNRLLKFGPFMETALRQTDSQLYATGHYVRLHRTKKRTLIKKGIDPEYDQSYFLILTDSSVFKKVVFPLGDMTKEDVRRIAREARLPVPVDRSSRDVCFAPTGYRSLFAADTRVKPGPIVDWKGRIVGRHNGIVHYTVGQRKGLGISVVGYPLYVQRLLAESNKVIVAPRRLLYAREILVWPVNFVGFERPGEPLRVYARCRYRQPDLPAVLLPHTPSFPNSPTNAVELRFEEAVFAPTVGQFAAFYCGDLLLGGGPIHDVVFPNP